MHTPNPCDHGRDEETLEIASRFHDGPEATALLCPEVMFDGAPILCVVRKHYVWQFLCGRDHSAEDVSPEDPIVTTVAEVVARDPSVAPVATMNDRHILRRRSVSDAWESNDDLSLWWI